MKLIRFGTAGNEQPGVELEEGKRIDCSAFGEDYNETFFDSNGIDRLASWLQQNAASCPEVPSDVRLGSPIGRPSKIVCIGLNYKDHAAESGMEVPSEPVVFFKATSSLVGPNDDLVIPRGGDKTDWEVELAIIIGKRASYVEADQAAEHIAGYCLHNDYSERAFQLEHCGQWVKGKSCDTFAPLGPFLATPDEVKDVNALGMWLDVNGERKQDGTTANLIFDIPFLISYLSKFMTLLPGDVISTGTPAGVGLGFDPPQYLHPGDVVELGIEGLGTSRQVAREWQAS